MQRYYHYDHPWNDPCRCCSNPDNVVSFILSGQTPSSPEWVGAWWIGFVISAVISLLVGIPLLTFPSILPGELKLIS